MAAAPVEGRKALEERFLNAATVEDLNRVVAAGGFDVNCCDDVRWGILHNAVVRRADVGETLLPAVLKLATTHGLDINRTEGGRTPLHFAALFGAAPYVAELLTAGAVVNAIDNRGCTALTLAAAAGQRGTTELLLKHGVDLDVRTVEGDTALSIAARRLEAKVVEILLDSDAPIGDEDSSLPNESSTIDDTGCGLLSHMVMQLGLQPDGSYLSPARARACRVIVHMLIAASAQRRRRHALASRFALVVSRSLRAGEMLAAPAATQH